MAYPQDVDRDGRRVVLDVGPRGFYDRGCVVGLPGGLDSGSPQLLKTIFTWWNGATVGTLFTIAKRGVLVGSDEFGNRYYESRDHTSYDGRKRRWVVYDGYAEASKVAPDWYGWLHYTYDAPPTEQPLVRRKFELDYRPNMTGTPLAWRPPGSLAAEGVRPAATGDYEAWKPE